MVSSKKSAIHTIVTDKTSPRNPPTRVIIMTFGEVGLLSGFARSMTSTEPAPTTRIRNSGAMSAIILQIAEDTSGFFVIALILMTSVPFTEEMVTYFSNPSVSSSSEDKNGRASDKSFRREGKRENTGCNSSSSNCSLSLFSVSSITESLIKTAA